MEKSDTMKVRKRERRGESRGRACCTYLQATFWCSRLNSHELSCIEHAG
jgi:hypothetical protein